MWGLFPLSVSTQVGVQTPNEGDNAYSNFQSLVSDNLQSNFQSALNKGTEHTGQEFTSYDINRSRGRSPSPKPGTLGLSQSNLDQDRGQFNYSPISYFSGRQEALEEYSEAELNSAFSNNFSNVQQGPKPSQ